MRPEKKSINQFEVQTNEKFDPKDVKEAPFIINVSENSRQKSVELLSKQTVKDRWQQSITSRKLGTSFSTLTRPQNFLLLDYCPEWTEVDWQSSEQMCTSFMNLTTSSLLFAFRI